MTCHEAREWLSALVDDAVDPARRAEVETHLQTCAECRLELEGLRATVGLLRRVEPARAPAGFVERVMEHARPTPWYRRLGAWMFLPLSVKLPAEAAAIVVIAGLAMLLIDRTPELRDAARVERSAPAPPIAEAPPRPRSPARETRDAGAPRLATPPPASRGEKPRIAPSEKVAPPPPITRDEETRVASSEQGARAAVPPAPPEPEPTPAPSAPAAESPVAATAPRPPVAAPSVRPPVETPLARPRDVPDSFDAKREPGQAEKKLSAPSSVGRAGGLAARSTDVVARLQVRDRGAAVAALAELLSKVGGSQTARRQEGSDVVIEVLIPEARYEDFSRGIETLGRWSAAPGLRQRVMLDAPYVRIPIRIVE